MLVLLRIIFGGLFLYCINEARLNARLDPQNGDLTDAGWLALTIIVAIACAAVWAPYFGEKISDPITGGMIRGSHIEREGRLVKAIRWLEARGHRRLAAWICFVEGVRRPWLPAAFVLGLQNAPPGSWLEKVYAREVFQFNNAENCMKAFQILQRHGIDPRPHKNPDVNMVLVSLERSVKPEPQPIQVQAAPPRAAIARDSRIRLGGKSE